MINHPNIEDRETDDGLTEWDGRDYSDKPSLGYRLKQTWKGKTKAGRIAGTILDLAEPLAPGYVRRARDLFQSKQKDRPMLSKVLSLKNFINLRDEDGNFDPQELLASVIQLAIAFGVIWGAGQLGISLEAIKEFLGGGANG